jgi:hypothetical protein
MTTYTFYCDHCGAVVELAPTNANAGLNMACRGQQEVTTSTNGVADPVTGNHPHTPMRMVGQRMIGRS